MVKNALIFLPSTLNRRKSGYLEGIYVRNAEGDAYYVLSDQPSTKNNAQKICYYSDEDRPKVKDFHGFYLHKNSGKITLCKFGDYQHEQPVRIVYNYRAFVESDCATCEEYGVHFNFLSRQLKDRFAPTNGGALVFPSVVSTLSKVEDCLGKIPLVQYSATVSHFTGCVRHCKWFASELNRERRLTPSIGCFLLACLLDVTLGCLLLSCFLRHQSQVVDAVDQSRETIIHQLKSLLTYLMGSPIGLKLNHAFNQSLGTFFFYHISLWRIFLLTLHPFIALYFKMLVLPGVLGLSYQVALLSDLVSITTFHCYCIYVYAARALRVQLKGLLSLWRLFIGRKYNPLREKVDSYRYNQNQLFVGTSGFTILLFLLPTTTMYYTVFLSFRLVVLLIQLVLSKLRIFLRNLPIYIVILRLLRLPQMCGTVHVKCRKLNANGVNFEATLNFLPMTVCIKRYGWHWTENEARLAFGELLHKIFTGTLI